MKWLDAGTIIVAPAFGAFLRMGIYGSGTVPSHVAVKIHMRSAYAS